MTTHLHKLDKKTIATVKISGDSENRIEMECPACHHHFKNLLPKKEEDIRCPKCSHGGHWGNFLTGKNKREKEAAKRKVKREVTAAMAKDLRKMVRKF